MINIKKNAIKIPACLLIAIFSTLTFFLLFQSPVKAQNQPTIFSLIEQPLWSENNDSFSLKLLSKNIKTGDLIEVFTLDPLDRESLVELRNNPKIKTPIDPFRLFVEENQLILNQITIKVPTNLNSSVTSNPGEIRPLIIKIIEPNGDDNKTLVTPLIHPPELSKFTPLSISLALKIETAPPFLPEGKLSLDPKTISDLTFLTETLLEQPEIPITMSLPPATIMGLSRSEKATDELLLSRLKKLVKNQLHLVSSPFVSSDPEAWRKINRFDVYKNLLDRGDLEIADVLQTKPDRLISFLSNTATNETVDFLNTLGNKNFLTDFEYLQPQSKSNNEKNQIVKLEGQSGESYSALPVDMRQTLYLKNLTGTTDDLQFLLADLSLLAFDSETLGIVIKLPKTISPKSLNIFFESVKKTSFLKFEKLPELFKKLENKKERKPEYKLLSGPVKDLSTKATRQSLAQSAVGAYSAVLGGTHPNTSYLNELIAITSATELDDEATLPYFTFIYDEIVNVINSFSSPKNQNVRLTSRQAELPFTIQNNLSYIANVLLVLQSDGRIDFPKGQTLEAKLLPGINRIQIPVEARASGDAQLKIGIRSPDSERLLQLDSNYLLIRTTRLSGVGIFLFAGAILFLAFWWLRSKRVLSSQLENPAN
tara:strand:- start:221 stop:2176 length:1956 start_codon:yes stop_codon:yes gene_type:complete